MQAKWPIRPELIPFSVAWSDWEYLYSPLDGMLVHHRVTPSINFPGTHSYTWVERGTLRVKCLAQEHNTVSPARAWTQIPGSGGKHTNIETITPLTCLRVWDKLSDKRRSDGHLFTEPNCNLRWKTWMGNGTYECRFKCLVSDFTCKSSMAAPYVFIFIYENIIFKVKNHDL